jgi:APA family basic amino acid/polyamine antiporter
MGRRSMTALMVNIVIGTSIYWVAGTVTGLVGDKSPWAVVVAGVVIDVVIVCFAEVASYFDAAGGPYLYEREAFGQFAGIYVRWLGCLVRVASTAAGCNLVITYLAVSWRPADKGVFPPLLITGILTISCSLNILGVKLGARVVNCFTVAKFAPLLLFILAALFLMFRIHLQVPQPVVEARFHNWAEALLVLVYSYGGFEGAVVPMSEAKNPCRDAPFALFTSLIASVFVYTLFTLVIVLSLPNAGSSKNAALDAAELLFGHRAVVLLSLGALISFAGYQFASILTGARHSLCAC